jgi:Domain of unknown function (DUF4157)
VATDAREMMKTQLRQSDGGATNNQRLTTVQPIPDALRVERKALHERSPSPGDPPLTGATSQFSSAIGQSPRMVAQRNINAQIQQSPSVIAQRKLMPPALRAYLPAQHSENEALHQGKSSPIQCVVDETILSGAVPESPSIQRQEVSKSKPNNTGLPDNLKSGIESLSGISMDGVKAHYNSPQPAQLNALAYAQGTDIHVAPGQERHLPHEAWHVVQQAQGRVQPTMQMKAGVPVNDDPGLEHEADVMGDKALSMGQQVSQRVVVDGAGNLKQSLSPIAQMKWVDDKGGKLMWDQLIDGVQWFYVKETEEMYYRIVNAGAIKIGNLDDYRALQGQPKEYGYWTANSAIDLDITAHLDPSVIGRDEVEQRPADRPTGMAAMHQGEFLATTKQVETGWAGLSPAARAGALIQSVNQYLQAAGVPPIGFELRKSDADSHGSFSESTWSITLNEDAFKAPSADPEAMAQLADTVFHEARHAEQFFRIARMLAALGYSVQQIRAKMVLNDPIAAIAANAAHANPMALDPNGLSTIFMETLEWYQSLYGAKAAMRRETILAMKDTKLQFYNLMGSMEALKTEFMLIKQELQGLKIDTEFAQSDLQMQRDEIIDQIKKLESDGKGESDEAASLRTIKGELEKKFGALARAFNETIAAKRPEQLGIVKRQEEIKARMEQVFAEFERWQDLYKRLPEELDAWALGASIQEAYKLLVS